MPKIPNWYMEQQKRYPKVIEAYERLGEATLGAGPLDGKTRSLAKLGPSFLVSLVAGVVVTLASPPRVPASRGD